MGASLEASARVHVEAGILRCPFCHEGCEPERSVACLECLGRHHEACWVELGHCATCGGIDRMIPESRALWNMTDEELLQMIRYGGSAELERYLDHCEGLAERCRSYVEQVRARSNELVTQEAVGELANKLALLRRHRVVGLPPARTRAWAVLELMRLGRVRAPERGINLRPKG